MASKRFSILFFFFFILLFTTLLSAQSKDKLTIPEQLKTKPVSVGYSFFLHSEILDEERFIQVALPDDYETSDIRYPVLYIVDGQWHFVHATQAQGTIANRFAPPLIVVSVHTDDHRNRDLLPPLANPEDQGGEADKFLKFITDELAPFVETNYRTSPYRLLFGSSFGGVFVMHALTTNPAFFNSYIATSPSMWWGNELLLKRTEKLLKENPDLNNRLFITVANEGKGMGVNALANLLKKYAPKNLKWKFEEYPDEVHETVSYRGMYRGLKFIFANWSSQPVNFNVDGHLLFPGDKVTVKMKSKAASLHYTLDGTLPTENSPVYKGPLSITEPTLIKALPIIDVGLPAEIVELDIQKVPSFEAEITVPKLEKGMTYSYYEGSWDMMPDFAQLDVIKTGIAQDFNMQESDKKEMFAMQYTGYFDAPKDALYTFHIASDDGSQLFIADKLIIDNDGLHDVTAKGNVVYLKKGKHKINVRYFQKDGGYALYMAYQSGKSKDINLFPSMFYCIEK